ncbi:hypothetical protein BGX21_010364 [Mortierella sp. AD011]|nr:hypothetical protein BGX20_010313 [Mortierella sp. AD010]KAF9394442.1 hypothetical protein BGX21_010364 [Mortierella sp. AD011]
MEETAVNLAHRYASAAEEHREQNKWEEAVDMHFKAADQFLLATNDTQNQEVIRTLKLMNANHIRQGKDLQRRIAKAAAAAAAVQPQQQSDVGTKHEGNNHRKSSNASNTTSAGMSGVTGSGGAGINAARQRSNSRHQQGNSGGLGKRHVDLPFQQNTGDSSNSSGSRGGVGPDGSYHGGSSGTSSNSSSAMIEESFTLVKNHMKDESDPFNKFWDAVENLVLKISSPVAFTTIPLDGDDPMSLHSPTTEEPPTPNPMDMPFAIREEGQAAADNNTLKIPSTTSNGIAQPRRQSKGHNDLSHMQESFFIIESPSASTSQLKGHSRNRSMTISDTVSISSTSNKSTLTNKRSDTINVAIMPRSTKTLEEYAIENQQLKMTLDKLSKRNLKLEKNLEGVMQMSIWTKDVQRSAMQLIKSQDVLRPMKQSIQDLSGGSNPISMQARLQELEAEVSQLKQENSKLNSLMKKYKQRWEDLKESAKKRRNATSTPPDGTPEDNSNVSGDYGADGRESPQRTPIYGPSTISSNPYSSSSLAGNPNSLSPISSSGGGGGSSSNNGSTRPLRSPSNSGPGLATGGGYQRRILMENTTGSVGLDATPLNMHRQSSGIVSSTSPRVLDSSSPRTNMTGVAGASEIQRPIAIAPTTPPFSIPPSPTMNAHIVTATGKSPQLGNHTTYSPSGSFPNTNHTPSPKLSPPTPEDPTLTQSDPTESIPSN